MTVTVLLSNTFTKSIQDRWKSSVIGAVSLGLLLVFGMAVYRDIDVSFWDELPEAFRNMFGIPEGADVGGLAYGAIYTGYGMLTMAAIALAGGSASIAGEERDGTIGVLFGNPVSRTTVLLSKAAGMLAALAIGFVILWVAGVGAPILLDVEIGDMHVTALLVMMFANAVFYGFMALALSAWFGKPGIASGTTTGIMVVSFVAVGLLPLIESLSGLAKFFPWYYFSSSAPSLNGMHWGHFAILVGGSLVFLGLGVVGLQRRDLRGQSVGVNMIDRLRENKWTHRAAEILAGKARVSRIWIKTASEHQGVFYIAVAMIVLMSWMIGPMFNMMDDILKDMADQFPEGMLALFGGGDLGTAEGFFQIEMFSLVVPIGVMLVTIGVGTGAMAGEEKRNTMGLLLANPVSRTSMVLQKMVAMVFYAVAIGIATFVGTAGGSILGSLGMDMGNIAAASVLTILLGLAFGGIAVLLGGAFGRTEIAVYGTVGIAVVTYIMNGFLVLNESTEAWAIVSPFYHYLGTEPLVNGMPWGNALVLLVIALVTTALGIALFNRRDLRARG